MKSFKQHLQEETIQLNEVLNNPYTYKWSTKGNDIIATSRLSDRTHLKMIFGRMMGRHFDNRETEWRFEFTRGGSYELSGRGDEYRVFATVAAAVDEFFKTHNPNTFVFMASKKDGDNFVDINSRTKLYTNFAKKIAKKYDKELLRRNAPDEMVFYLKRHNSEYEPRPNTYEKVL